MSSAPAESVDQKPKATNKVRKRAPKACLSCRSRKVRCDVSQRGRPCMNCYLDSETCIVTGRASRFRRNRENENVQASHPPYSGEGEAACDHSHSAEAVVRSRTNGEPVPQPVAEKPASVNGTPAADNEKSEPTPAPQAAAAPNTAHAIPKTHSRPVPMRHTSTELNGASTPVQPPVPNGLQWPGEQNMNLTADITFSYYPWLSISNLANILPQDVNYLDLQGCLRVPTRAVLDEFVQQYFLHVHPLLPLLNEGDFWEMYCHQGFGAAPPEKMSLLVFQSMLFATCNFLSRDSIKALGFPSIRATRAAFYRRAKLLYDFESESSPIAIAQAALLLTHWSPATNKGAKNPNSGWLSTAIQHAKSAEAHRYYTVLAGNGPHNPRLVKRQNTLKRLWWCCIIRDRVLGLCVRRSIQITRAHFDFDAYPSLGYVDLGDEIERSKVYNPGTKRCLIEILVQIVELCVVLTDILMLVFPLDDLPGWGRQLAEEDAGKVKQCKTELRRWYKGATLRFPMFGGAGVARMSTGNGAHGKEFQHDSVILYTNMMYMYYHSSRVALCHHEILHLAVASAAPDLNGNVNPDMSTIYENRHEIQDASCGVTECLKELIQLRLARWLPISAVACTALPLVLHILDVKLSSPSGPTNSFDPNTQSALKQHRLNILIEAMKTYQPQYDGVDWVSETIRHIINMAQLDDGNNERKAANGNNGGISDWTDILSSHPSAYLRLALTMDLSLSKNRLPEDGDFPTSLRGLFTGGFSPIKILLGHGGKVQQSAPTGSQGMAAITPHSGPSMQVLSDWAAGDQSVAFGLEAGMLPALPSDEETSPASTGLGTDGTSPDGPVVGEADINQMADQAFADAMDILEGNVLDAFAFRDEETGSPSDIDGVSYDDGDPAGEWVEKAWHEEDGTHFRADQETAKALLEAMDTDPVGCAA